MAKIARPPVPLTTPQLVELAKQKLAVNEPPERRGKPMTDYRLAKLLGVRQQTISNWQAEKSHISREFVTKFAEITGLPEAYVFACVELEREKDPGVRRILVAIAAGLGSLGGRRAATMILGLGLAGVLAAPVPSQAAVVASAAGPYLYIMSNRRRRAAGRRRRPRVRPGVIHFAA